jgi:hypothetical protein
LVFLPLGLSLVACGGSGTSGTGTGGVGAAGGGGSGGGGSGGTPGGGGFSGGTGGITTGGGGGSGGGTGGGGSGGTGGGPCAPPAPGTLQGDFLLTVSASLSPKKPFLFHAIVNTVDNGGQTALAISIEPLDAKDRTTPVAPLVTLPPASVDAQGKISGGPWTLMIPGAANPITATDVEGTASIAGSLCGVTTFYCGDVTGSITKPLAYDLNGSTYTLERYTPPATPPPVINCNKDSADPPPT